MSKPTMTLREVTALCSEWQSALHLDHWRVNVSISPLRDIGPDKQGKCTFTERILHAHIQVLEPADYPPGYPEQDIEETIVHELLHLWFAAVTPLSDDEFQDTMFEQAIDTVARTLVEVKRRKNAGDLQPTAE